MIMSNEGDGQDGQLHAPVVARIQRGGDLGQFLPSLLVRQRLLSVLMACPSYDIEMQHTWTRCWVTDGCKGVVAVGS